MDQPGVLTHQAIRRLCGFAAGALNDQETDSGPIRRARLGNVRSASYDLRIGAEYYLRAPDGSGRLQTRWLGPRQSLILDHNELVVIRAEEQLLFPADMVGHLSLKMDLLLDGLIMASQSQVDAGYRGWIFGLLYNLSDRAVTLKRGDSFLRLELVRLDEPSAQPYVGDYRDRNLEHVLTKPVGSSLQDMRERVDRAEKRFRNLTIGGVVAAVIAVAGLVASLGSFIAPLSQSVDDLKQQNGRLQEEVNPSTREAQALRTSLSNVCRELKRIEQHRPGQASSLSC